MTSPRLLRPRSYSLQFRILYFVLYWRLTRLDFAATMTLPPDLYDGLDPTALCLEDKRPVWRSWQKLRPGLDVVLAHNGPLGLQPWSISTTALDVDAGDPGELVQAWPPMAVLNSRRAGGRHLYYSDTAGRGNAHFEAYGCAGEIRSAKGYLILWHDGAARLADALHDPIARARRWPRDLFELAGVGAVTLPAAVKKPTYRYKPSDQSRQTWAAAAAALELETIKQGLRNVKLFDSVRFWAYSVPRGQDLEAWTRRVRVHALEQNRRFPEPLDESEVKQTAYSISTWCWSGGGARWHFDHSPTTQARRGVKSGKVRRAGTPLEHNPEPWIAEGMSRRTWYRRRRWDESVWH